MAFGRYPNFHLDLPHLDDLYIQGKELGEGGFGTTYLCKQVATGRQLACKCLYKVDIMTRSDCKMILREIAILKHLNLKAHPNIVAFEGAFEDARCVYIIMELCEGGDLFYRVARDGPFSEKRAAKIIKEIVSAIETCHREGIIHRDLKLENVLFQTKDRDSPIKIIDFGLAHFVEPNPKDLTDLVGTPCYIAPEVWERQHGPKADIWSIGVILYILLVAHFPFDTDSLEGTYNEVMSGQGLCFEQLEPWCKISEDAKDLVKKMMKVNVKDRLSAREVLEHHWILENTQ